LFEIVIPKDQFKLTLKEVEDEVIVFDGGNDDTQPILPSDGLTWRSVQVSTLHIHDVINPHFGLTIIRSNNCHPFIRLPRGISLKILGKAGHHLIYSALEACERLRKASLVRSDKKRIFGDYGKQSSIRVLVFKLIGGVNRCLIMLHTWRNFQSIIKNVL
jgi:hypothetical protein